MTKIRWNRRDLLRLAGLAAAPGALRPARGAAAPASFLKLPDRFQTERTLNSGTWPGNQKSVLCELPGPGCIQHVWTAMRPAPMANRNMILRIWFDGEANPSVEGPLGDLFGLCHGIPMYPMTSLYLTSQDQAGYNMYFPMPFAQSARVELEVGPERPGPLYFHIDWHRYPSGSLEEPLRFHAQWRREFPAQAFGEEYTVLDAVGRGRLTGLVYGVRLYDETARWSHGGSDNIYVDGEAAGEKNLEPFVVRGSGGEDTFGAAYGGVLHKPESHLYMGMPYYYHEDIGRAKAAHRLVGYRFYERDAIQFEKSLHFRFGCVANDICSTAYWYQTEPHRPFVRMPPWPKVLPGTELLRGTIDLLRQTGSPSPVASLCAPHDGEWWLCGPFENEQGEAMGKALPPEQGAQPDETARYDGGFGPKSPWRQQGSIRPDQHMARWVRRMSFHNFVDFAHVFRPTGPANNPTWPAAACAMTELDVDQDTDATIYLAYDDRMTLQLNGAAPRDLGQQDYFRQKPVPVRLRRGSNRLLLKSANTKGLNWGAWCFACQVVRRDGSAIAPRLPNLG